VTPDEIDAMVERLQDRMVETGGKIIEQPAVGREIEFRTKAILNPLYKTPLII
jgi:hypothetical protein